MEDYIKVSAKTVEDAIIEASIQLGTSSDNIEYRVIEKETKGFLGIGAKKAVIEARKKPEKEEDIISEVFGGNKKDTTVKTKKAPEKKPEAVKTVKKAPVKKEEVKADTKKEVYSEVSDFEPEETVSKMPKTPIDPKEVEAKAEEFLKNVFATMDMQVEIKAECQDDTLNIDLSGEDMGILIGKRGQTLDSMQYLVSLVVNKGKSSYVRVKLDTENYRNRRKTTLENLAKNIAFKVKKTRRPVYLEPMNPYERRIIHSALQNDPYVTTHSEGEEPCRKVVVTLKKRERNSYSGRDYKRSEVRDLPQQETVAEAEKAEQTEE